MRHCKKKKIAQSREYVYKGVSNPTMQGVKIQLQTDLRWKNQRERNKNVIVSDTFLAVICYVPHFRRCLRCKKECFMWYKVVRLWPAFGALTDANFLELSVKGSSLKFVVGQGRFSNTLIRNEIQFKIVLIGRLLLPLLTVTYFSRIRYRWLVPNVVKEFGLIRWYLPYCHKWNFRVPINMSTASEILCGKISLIWI
jgi:hypothetical protein